MGLIAISQMGAEKPPNPLERKQKSTKPTPFPESVSCRVISEETGPREMLGCGPLFRTREQRLATPVHFRKRFPRRGPFRLASRPVEPVSRACAATT